MSAILVNSDGRVIVRNNGLRVGSSGEDCCCGDGPNPPEDPGTDPNRDETDPTGDFGCPCFVQYSSILVTVAGIVNCTPQRRLYACSPGSPVEVHVVITSLPQGTWSIPVTYSPANSQVGYTNENVILVTIPNAIEIRSTNGALYSRGGLRLRWQYGRVRACQDKRIEAACVIEATNVIVQDEDALNHQRPDWRINCGDANGQIDTRGNTIGPAFFGVDCTVTCVQPLTCADIRLPATCPDPPLTMDGALTAGGSFTVTAV